LIRATGDTPYGIGQYFSEHAIRRKWIMALMPRIVRGLCLCLLSGCHDYDGYRVMKSTADVQDEKAELLRAYRLCMAYYEDDPPKAREVCTL
jgi:hypothetical protein